jgi:spore coat polysaccharide biosynthesis protein SpsF
MHRVVAILQARMTSTRLPGKVLLDLGGRSLLGQELARLRRSKRLTDIVIATTTNATDDALAELAQAERIEIFRGDEHDVLGRYRDAARQFEADVIVRVTGDCPLIDGTVVDSAVDRLEEEPCDYASNTIDRTYPRGLDVEVFHRDVLERIARLARSVPAREHVTYFLHREQPQLFITRQIRRSEDASDLRWTVDTVEDLDLMRRLFVELNAVNVSTDELIARVRQRPDLIALNQHIVQKSH